MSCVYPHLFLLFWIFICHHSFHPSCAMSIKSLNNSIRCVQKERYALLNFKLVVELDSCELLSSWEHQESSRDCCNWSGVHCSNRSGHVIVLDLHGIVNNNGYNNCYLKGNLSPSLGELKHLKHLNLSNNQFSGEIPHQLGNLSHLTFLDLSNNFHLFSHNLRWLSNLTLLRHLNLRNTYLIEASDWFQVVSNLPSLRVLHLDLCLLPSIILPPFSYINSSTNLNVVTLAGNYLNDTSIFQWLFNLTRINTHLVHVDLSLNSFSGLVPSAFGKMSTLSYLDLSKNQLEGPIPTAIGNMYSLSHLDLSHNQLTSHIPCTLGNLKSLAFLQLSDNSFSGAIPDAIGNLPLLTYLKLSNNLLSSPIPDAIKTLKSLEYLDLSNNSISSSIPGFLGYMFNLKYLDLSHNLLTGIIPSQLDQHGLLNNLDLSFNHLSGPIPAALWKFDVEYFSGNFHLCGEPLPVECSLMVEGDGGISTQLNENDKTDNNNDGFYIGLCVSVGIGFYLGFWGVCGTLVFKHSWRYAFFKWVDNVISKIYVTIALYVARLQTSSEMQDQ